MTSAIVIGGGFYGCMVALHLKARGLDVKVLERGERLLSRSSYVNQARVHNGYHYPRSFNTAYRSRFNAPKFVQDFKEAVVDDFTHIYAIVRGRSKVSARQFYTFCNNIEAPVKYARPALHKLFNDKLIEQAFEVQEAAFDASIIAKILEEKMHRANVPVMFGTEVKQVCYEAGRVRMELSDAVELAADMVFNCTYAALEQVLGQPSLRLKHEITEIALVKMPPPLEKIGVTVMDGPFFSAMPFPAEGLHSFTHVRYTPHCHFRGEEELNPYARLAEYPKESRFAYMYRDALRYMPSLAGTVYDHSLFEIKTLMQANEVDDGRPILFHQQQGGLIWSILGSKIDNIFDVLERIDMVLAA